MNIWNETAQRCAKTVDRLGKAIDPGILETVIALNVLGYCTTASCEGHVDWGLAAPWVDIDPPGDIKTLRDQLRAAQQDEAREISDQLKYKQRVLFQALSTLLDQFYRQPRGYIPYDHMLIPNLWAAGRIRLEPLGLEMQPVVSSEIKAQKLVAYRQEMRDFTAFLKSSID